MVWRGMGVALAMVVWSAAHVAGAGQHGNLVIEVGCGDDVHVGVARVRRLRMLLLGNLMPLLLLPVLRSRLMVVLLRARSGGCLELR